MPAIAQTTSQLGSARSQKQIKWAPSNGWGRLNKLPEPERTAAHFIAYLVTTIYESGPTSMFALDDAGNIGTILQALTNANMIRTHEIDGVHRWSRR